MYFSRLDRPQPRVPHWMIPQAWGLPNELVEQYIEFDAQDACVIGGDKVLQVCSFTDSRPIENYWPYSATSVGSTTFSS
jgi:hypothetical protein